MPYGVFKTGSEEDPFCVYRVNEDGGRMGKSLGCHPSKKKANSQIRAIGMATHKMGGEMDKPPVIIDMRTSTKEESQEEELQEINNAFQSAFPSPSSMAPSYEYRPWIHSTYDTYVIARVGDDYYKVGYSQSGDETTFDPIDQWKLVEKAPDEWIEISEKAGRRLRSDKLSALRNFKTKIDEMLKDLADLIGWADYDDQKPVGPFRSAKALSGITGFKGADGRDWLLTWTTNAFIDRDEEIFTTKSIEEYVLRNREEYGEDPSTWSKKGEFKFWHLPGAKFADILWQGMSGRFLVEAGPFGDDEIATTFKEFFQAHPEGHPEIAPEGWGASHGYKYYPEDREDKIYDWFEKHETSILPASAAANPHNPQMEVFIVDQKQLDALKIIGDDALVALVVETGEGLTKQLEDERIAYKAKQAFSAKIQVIAEGLEDDGPKKELLALVTEIADFEGTATKEGEGETKKAPPGRKQAVTTEVPVADEKDLEEGLRKFVPQLRTISESVTGDAGKELVAIVDAMEAGADRKEGDPPPEKDEKDEAEFVTRAELQPALKLISQSILDLRTMLKELTTADKEKIAKIVEDTPKASLEHIVAQSLIGTEEALLDGRKTFAKDKPKETQPEVPGTLGIPLLDNIKQLNQQVIEQRQ